ncbi:MAG: PHP domain-containing protein [Pseudomonadota bacterium]
MNYLGKESPFLKKIDNPFCSMEQRLEALEAVLSKQNMPVIAKDLQSRRIDFHLHSNYSDGYWTSSGLFLEAYRRGMSYISLTDHDCFTGIEEGFKARDLIYQVTGKKIGFIPGVEFSTNYIDGSYKIREIHILGYFPSKTFKKFRSHLNKIDIFSEAYLEAFQKCRILRIYEMVKKFNQELPYRVGGTLLALSKIGDPILPKMVKRGLRCSVSPGRLLTCTGVYEILILYKSGRIDEIYDDSFSKDYLEKLTNFMEPFNSPHELMGKYFGNTEPSAKVGYIGKTEDPKWAVKMIQTMGGIPVLAHPILYFDLLHELLEELFPLGLLGVEVISSNATQKDLDQLREMDQFIEKSYPNLVVTAGSDCHGHSVDGKFDYTPNNPMGLRQDFEDLLMKHTHRMIHLFDLECEAVS